MPLYISDDAVNDLAERPAALTGENKTEAVRSASEMRVPRDDGRPFQLIMGSVSTR
jgi:hypothetical protein